MVPFSNIQACQRHWRSHLIGPGAFTLLPPGWPSPDAALLRTVDPDPGEPLQPPLPVPRPRERDREREREARMLGLSYSLPTPTAVVAEWRLGIVVVQRLSRVGLLLTPWTVARQAPLSMGFSRQEYWSGLPFPSTETRHIIKQLFLCF